MRHSERPRKASAKLLESGLASQDSADPVLNTSDTLTSSSSASNSSSKLSSASKSSKSSNSSSSKLSSTSSSASSARPPALHKNNDDDEVTILTDNKPIIVSKPPKKRKITVLNVDEEPPKKKIKRTSQGRRKEDEEFALSDSEAAPTPPTKKAVVETVDSGSEEITVEVQINIDIYSPAEMQKSFKKRLPAKSGFMNIDTSTSFNSFLRQIRKKITKIAKLSGFVDDDDIVLQFIVPCWVLNPLDLDDAEAYKHMLSKSQKSKDPVATVIVELKEGLEEPDTDFDAKAKEKKKKGKKSKIPSETDILPANTIINQKIGLLKAKWTCHANDGSDYCWISGEAKDHLRLTHAHFLTWAAAWANDSCDEETPPNHALFDIKGGKTPPPTALQRRIANNQPAVAAAPTINNHFTLPDTLLEIIRPGSAQAAAPVTNNHTATQPITDHLMLLPPNHRVGERLTIGTFCINYDLDSSIADKFTTNGYRNTSVFYLVKLTELEVMNFLPGEIAELRDAVQRWAEPS
ncbi:hypothetical protein C8J57DRAFT_1565261 [Mycena rebaudengoi]|nr:hypothetical protein C8J57DRAFT_1565261 [Mycena rebaudengoi]